MIVSGFVALTLSPMMCSKLLRHEPKHGPIYNGIERFLSWLTAGYRGVLALALSARWLVMLVFAVVAGSSVWHSAG